jgi:hypothetical protein
MFRYTLFKKTMNELPANTYIPAEPGETALPLERYLPPCPNGVIAKWLGSHFSPGSWVIDPLGTNPLTPIQAVRAGYRVLTARINPLVRFTLEVIGGAPRENDFQQAINSLMRTQIAGEPLSSHLQGLYETQCTGCNQMIQAQGFIWEKGHDQPQRRLVDCPHCGQKGDFPLSQHDLEVFARIEGQKNKTRARAKQRVLLGLEGSVYGLEDALDCYPDRPLYFLMTCINKLEGLSMTDEAKRLVRALLLSLMDAGNNLWHWPSKNERPLTLNTPPVFLEHNLWLELQKGISSWTILDAPIPITRWPDQPPPTGGICLYQRSGTDLRELAAMVKPQALLVNFPRPNQAWLTFTVLWSGWLWGVQAVQHLHQSLENRRYDWRWLAGSLQLALRQADILLPENGLAFGVINDATPSNLFAILCAARTSQLKLKGIAFYHAKQLAQVEWVHSRTQEKTAEGMDASTYADTIQEAVRQKGEPLSNEEVMIVCRIQHALREKLPENLLELDENLLDDHLDLIKKVIQDTTLFTTIKNTNVAGGNQWWPARSFEPAIPLMDRLENSIFSILQKGEPVSSEQVNHLICSEFPGLFIPSLEAIQICLESFAAPIAGQENFWQLREEDKTTNRAGEISKTINTLKYLGVKLGCRMEGENPLIWLDRKDQLVNQFFTLGNGIFSPILSQIKPDTTSKSILVFPASRSRWMLYKLRNNAVWQSQLDQGWQLLKMRHLRKIAGQADFNQALWEVQLNADPPAWDPPVQLQIL